ncbi:MAG: hypothetical protein LUE29_03775 [Lachnospiraceae bacterium]|nr:hypothetical protein [Lachnospiraceae bacterium]
MAERNLISVYDRSLSPEPLMIEVTEINGQTFACIRNRGWLPAMAKRDSEAIWMVGIEESEDLEISYFRQGALDQIWKNANKAIDKLVQEGYSWWDAFWIARAINDEEVVHLERIGTDVSRLGPERGKAFREIERREHLKEGRTLEAGLREESAREAGAKKKAFWLWRKRTDAAV